MVKTFTFDELVHNLQLRGLRVDVAAEELELFRAIGYYRLRPFWSPYQEKVKVSDQRPFRPGASLSQVLSDYNTDVELRRLLAEGVEILEVSMRSSISRVLGDSYGQNALTQESIFRSKPGGPRKFSNHAAALESKLKKQRDRIRLLESYSLRHGGIENLPIWVACESLDFSDLSQVFSELEDVFVKTQLATDFCSGLHRPQELSQILHQASVIRNICAHQGRIWDCVPEPHYWVPRNLRGQIFHPHTARNRHTGKPTQGDNVATAYGVLTVWADLFRKLQLSGDWAKRVATWAEGLSDDALFSMGFHDSWRSSETWIGHVDPWGRRSSQSFAV